MESYESPLFELVRRVKDTDYPTLICAHRGDSQNAPENTLAAFRLALEAGSDMIELDVHPTADDRIVVMHDLTVDRTTNGSGELAAMKFEAVRELDAGAWFDSSFRGEPVPELGELLDLVKGRAAPIIEIKQKLAKAPKIGPLVVDMLRRHRMLDEVVVVVRDKTRALEFERLAPQLSIAMISFTGFQARGLIRTRNVSGADLYWKSLTPKLVRELREAGMYMTPWTVNKRDDLLRCLTLGCECIITDCPVVLRDVVEEWEVERSYWPWDAVALAESQAEEEEPPPPPPPQDLF